VGAAHGPAVGPVRRLPFGLGKLRSVHPVHHTWHDDAANLFFNAWRCRFVADIIIIIIIIIIIPILIVIIISGVVVVAIVVVIVVSFLVSAFAAFLLVFILRRVRRQLGRRQNERSFPRCWRCCWSRRRRRMASDACASFGHVFFWLVCPALQR